eukprot:760234-Hanusia_phi.AAC.9
MSGSRGISRWQVKNMQTSEANFKDHGEFEKRIAELTMRARALEVEDDPEQTERGEGRTRRSEQSRGEGRKTRSEQHR